MRTTHTFAVLNVSPECFEHVKARLTHAGVLEEYFDNEEGPRIVLGTVALQPDPPPEVYYFGCLNVPGHFMHGPVASRPHLQDTPWGNELDGHLLTTDHEEGEVVCRFKDGWTVVAFWDRSGDHRPGSNSAFLARGHWSPGTLTGFARAQWPEVFQRPGFPPLLFTERL